MSNAPSLMRLYSRQSESSANSSGVTRTGRLAASRFIALHSLSAR